MMMYVQLFTKLLLTTEISNKNNDNIYVEEAVLYADQIISFRKYVCIDLPAYKVLSHLGYRQSTDIF